MGPEKILNEEAVEPLPIQDTYISGVHRVEFLGRNNVRIHMFCEEDGHRVIVGKAVMAVDDIPLLITTIMKATWHRLLHAPLMEAAIGGRIGRH